MYLITDIFLLSILYNGNCKAYEAPEESDVQIDIFVLYFYENIRCGYSFLERLL